MSNHQTQAAPSPDYSVFSDSTVPSGDLQTITITCRDCGDTELQFVQLSEVVDRIRRQRCDECQESYDEKRHAQARAAVNAALDMTVRRDRECPINCDECGEEVGSFVGYADHLDGKAGKCPHCHTFGKIVVGDDEGSAHIRFRAYTAAELRQVKP